LARAEGLLLVTGAPGTGKTTLIRECIREAGSEKVTFVEISSGSLDRKDFLYLIALHFGIEPEGLSSAIVLVKLKKKFEALYDEGRRAVLLVDEAQGLQVDALDEVKTLSNLEYEGMPLVQLFLVGQKSLAERLKKPESEQVMQRITAACELVAMSEEESKHYVLHCLSSSGWNGSPEITDSVLENIYVSGEGIPRRTNLICSRLLLRGMLSELAKLDVQDL